GNVREAIASLQAAERFEENEELVNGAARHLADLLVAIQKAGVAA
ncbi:internal head protein, partial [Escherichia coli]|nr:internal head protein [Escherichia coli]